MTLSLTNWFSCISKKGLKNILFRQVKRIRGICNNDEDLSTALENLERILLVNYYPIPCSEFQLSPKV